MSERALTLSNRSLIQTGILLLAGLAMHASAAAAEQRFILRTPTLIGSGAPAAQSVCQIAGCTVQYPLDGELEQVFLVTTIDAVDPASFVQTLLALPGVANAEIDLLVQTDADEGDGVPPSLTDRQPVSFYGATVWQGYVNQPAAQRVRVQEAQEESQRTGKDVKVAVIDTGVDPQQPVLAGVLIDGYDFTRNVAGGSERGDVGSELDQSTMAVVEESSAPVLLNQSTMAVVDQSTMAVVDSPDHPAFGHGTMVAGIIHLVAPEARIMPLKAFRSDGRGYSSDILRAVYYGVFRGAKVINMSFSYSEPSGELATAINHAMTRGVVVIASAGNQGQHAAAYPAAIENVIGVASTDDNDVISEFSNYGEELFWIAAPGEAVVTTYPFGTYAAVWGTSFSAPFAAGSVALMAEASPSINQSAARLQLGEAALPIAGVTRGRIDLMRPVTTPGPPILP